MLPYCVWAVNADSYNQNKDLVKAINVKSLNQVPSSLENFKSALAKDSFGQHETLIQLLSFGSRLNESGEVSEEIKKSFYNLAVSEVDRYYENNPKDSRLNYVAGQYIAQSGNLDLSLKYFDEAIRLSPKKQSIYYAKIEVLLFMGKKEEALDLARYVYELNPNNDNFWNFYILNF